MSTPVAYTSLWKVCGYSHYEAILTLDSLLETFPPAINDLVSFCNMIWPYILPPLVSVLLESPLSLRTWIAVQKIAARCPPPTSPRRSRFHTLRRHVYTHFAPMYFLFASLLSSYLQCLKRIQPERMQLAEIIGFGPLFWFASSRLFGFLFRVYKMGLQRDADGGLHITRTLRPSVPRIFQVVPVLLGLFVTHSAICFDDSVCKAILQVALLHMFMSLDARAKESMRSATHYALTNIATLLALTIFLTTYKRSIKLLVDPSPSQSSSLYPAWEEFISNRAGNSTFSRLDGHVLDSELGADIGEDAIENPLEYRWTLFALSVLWNIFPVEFITLCARFDYMRFAKRNGLDVVSLPFERLVPPPPRSTDTIAELPPDTEGGYLSEKEQLEISDDLVAPGYDSPREAPEIHTEPLAAPPPAYSDVDNHTSTLDQTTTTTEISDLYSQEEITIPLPSSLSLPTPTRIPSPTFLTSLSAYLTSTLFLSSCIYFTFAIFFPAYRTSSPTPQPTSTYDHYQSEIVKYMAPLLPIVTLPLTTFATSLGLIFRNDGDGLVTELWGYEENWRAEGRRIALEITNGVDA